jgi:hypothetical protein
MTDSKIVKLPRVNPRDPRNIKGDFYTEVADLLQDIKNGRQIDENRMTIRERIAAMALVGRMLSVLGIGEREDEDNAAGSAVRKYAAAFSTHPHDARRRKKNTRPESFDPDTVVTDLVNETAGDDDGEQREH